MVVVNFRRAHSPSRLTWSEGWRPVYIHQINRVNSRNDFGRDSSAINIVAIITVCLSVSVTSRCYTKTAKRRITQTTPHETPGTLVS